MHNNIVISRAAMQDADLLTGLSVTTFGDTFGGQNRKVDMDKYLAEVMSLENLTTELADEANYFFIAWHSSMPAGYAKLRANREPDIIAVLPLELERIYVLREYQDKKAGAALMKHCIDFAKSNGHDVLWLGVWELNHKAIGFYKKWGYEFCGSHPFLLGDDLQTDVLMRKDL
jgi:GNAT superfamily N-acetyltransferase